MGRWGEEIGARWDVEYWERRWEVEGGREDYEEG